MYYSLPVLAGTTIVRTEFKQLLAPLPHASSVKNHPRLHNTAVVSIRLLPGLKWVQDNLRCLRLTSAIAKFLKTPIVTKCAAKCNVNTDAGCVTSETATQSVSAN